MTTGEAAPALLGLARVNHGGLQLRESFTFIVLGFLQLRKQLGFQHLELFGLLFVSGYLVSEVGALFLDVVASYLVLVIEELLTFLIAQLLVLLDLPFSRL